MVTLVPRRSKLILGRSPGRDAHGGRDRDLLRLADAGADPRGAVNARATRLAPGRLSLPPAAGHRLLCHALAGPLLAPLSEWPQGRPTRPPAGHQPADRLPATGPLRQAGRPAGPPPPGRTPLRQAAAPLR